MLAPTGGEIKTALSFGEWKHKDDHRYHRSGTGNKDYLKLQIELLLRRGVDEQCSVLADGQFALRQCVSVLRQPDYSLRRQSEHYHCLNDRAVKSRTRRGGHWPSGIAIRAIRVKIVRIAFASARPAASRMRRALLPQICAMLIRTRVQKGLLPISPVGLTQYRRPPFSMRIAPAAADLMWILQKCSF